MTKIFTVLNRVVWGVPALVLILGVGVYLTVRLGAPQLRLFPRAMGAFFAQFRPQSRDRGEVSPFRALCTALAATVGTGNLVGVAGAICLGGPGAIFWMWVCGVLGMATKFAEAVLAVRYRVKGPEGWSGGPMYTISRGLGRKWRPLAVCYSLFGLIAAFGVGNGAQVSAVMTGADRVLAAFGKQAGLPLHLGLGLLLALVIGLLLSGGARRIGAAAEALVPFAAAAYILLCALALFRGRKAVLPAFASIIRGAFDPKAVTGGMLGSSFQALRIGCSRGVFTNEAGMGTASMAHASADVSHPAQQGLMGIVEVFLDTIVICTLTALVILVSGVPILYGRDAGAALTTDAFAHFFGPAAPVVLTAFLTLFAVATVLGWGFYGLTCARFLGISSRLFTFAQVLGVIGASVADTALIWQFSETVNGLMTIPNLISLAVLTPELIRLMKE